jgi:histidinol-phosphatase (PHP family)
VTRLPDYHTHTGRCGHASGEPRDYVEAALEAGLLALGVSDHLPLLPERDPQLSMDESELGDYVSDVLALKEKYPEYVLLGIEADYRPETIDEVAALLAAHPFDYVIGSVHFLGDWGFDDPHQLERYEGRDLNKAWAEYFELVGDAAESGLFTTLGHLDLMKKFGHRPSRALDRDLDRLVGRIAQTEVLVEINTAGLHKAVGEMYPAPNILRLLHEAGVNITFGSDAHKPEQVGRDFAQAETLARSAGFDSFAVLEASTPGVMTAAEAPGGAATDVAQRAAVLLLPFEDDRSGEDGAR